MPKKRNVRFVIFAGPQQFGRPGTRYYSKSGKVTDHRPDAARFSTFEDAHEFAQENNIKLSEMHYIGQEDFTNFELSLRD